MIVGHGDIAGVLKDREDRVYFASGVSNSQENRLSEYQREMDLLSEQDKSRHIVYFSSLAVFYTDTRYAKHKRQMERLIKRFKHYTIVRLGNISWGNNPHTFINYIKNKLDKGEKAEVWDTYRYVVEKDEFLYWINLIPEWNCEMNIVGRRMKVMDAVKQYGHKHNDL